MSTSLLYHALNIVGYRYRSTQYVGKEALRVSAYLTILFTFFKGLKRAPKRRLIVVRGSPTSLGKEPYSVSCGLVPIWLQHCVSGHGP
jgi:hypothetical protein